MSAFIKSLTMLIVFTLVSLFLLNDTFYTFDSRVFGTMTKICSVIALLFITFDITSDMRDIVVLKYKIIIDGSVHAKYLTSLWLFIPYWKPVETTTDSYKIQNIFGAKFDHYYDIEVTYGSERDAVHAIENHKKTITRNRNIFFQRPIKKIKQVKYI